MAATWRNAMEQGKGSCNALVFLVDQSSRSASRTLDLISHSISRSADATQSCTSVNSVNSVNNINSTDDLKDHFLLHAQKWPSDGCHSWTEGRGDVCVAYNQYRGLPCDQCSYPQVGCLLAHHVFHIYLRAR
jgi:hypothetical protein